MTVNDKEERVLRAENVVNKLVTDVKSKNGGDIAECYDCGSYVFVVENHIDHRKLVCADCGRVYAEGDEFINKLLEGAREFTPWED